MDSCNMLKESTSHKLTAATNEHLYMVNLEEDHAHTMIA
jgi:hypothetical protein